MADITATPGPLLPETQEGKDGDHLHDAAGNWFVADSLFLIANSNDTWINVTKYDPNGSQLGVWTMRPPTNWKFDGTPALSNNGTTLVVRSFAHTYNVTPRRSRPFSGAIPGVFVVGSAPPPPQPGPTVTLPNVQAGVYQKIG